MHFGAGADRQLSGKPGYEVVDGIRHYGEVIAEHPFVRESVRAGHDSRPSTTPGSVVVMLRVRSSQRLGHRKRISKFAATIDAST